MTRTIQLSILFMALSIVHADILTGFFTNTEELKDFNEEVVKEMNKYREKDAALCVNDDLMNIAQKQSQKQRDKNIVAHRGKGIEDEIKEKDIKYKEIAVYAIADDFNVTDFVKHVDETEKPFITGGYKIFGVGFADRFWTAIALNADASAYCDKKSEKR